MKILFIGDIVAKLGRQTVAKVLPDLLVKNNIDLVIANAENSAHGKGTTPELTIIDKLGSYELAFNLLGL